ncbi:MAG: sigma-70 family RNA polymerase sigma factor [Sphingomonadales bacterium]|nr:sigma-70 family RNA polymerase sigma factor [Sphingomonadales bacterium]
MSRILRVFLANKGLIASVVRRYSLYQLDVADITQETILRALEAEKRTEIREPRRFLVGIAKNVARTELQRRSKMTLEVLDDFSAETYVSDEPSVDDVVDGRHRMRVFWRAVATLPPQCQKVFVLKHVHGASHKEIADKLDIAVSTVEKHVALGLRRCREEMLKGLSTDADPAEEASILGIETAKR